MRCYLDGNALCIVKEDFTNIQESDCLFIILTEGQIEYYKKMEANDEKNN